jgi:hypothetical protein
VTLLALASAKGSPGVTTATLALGLTSPAEPLPLVAECDPAGGDMGAWYDLPGEPGLASLAPAVRLAAVPRDPLELLSAHSQAAPAGLDVLPAPASAEQAGSALALVPAAFWEDLDRRGDVLVLADCGRLGPASPAQALVERARLLVLLVRPFVADLAHLAGMLEGILAGWVRDQRVGVVAVGRGQFQAAEIEATLGVEVLAELPEDRQAAAALAGSATVSGGLQRTALLRAARALAGTLAGRSTGLPGAGTDRREPGR